MPNDKNNVINEDNLMNDLRLWYNIGSAAAAGSCSIFMIAGAAPSSSTNASLPSHSSLSSSSSSSHPSPTSHS